MGLEFNGIGSMPKGGNQMTVKELYEWAEQNRALDFDIEIQYRDGGGSYCGRDDCDPAIEASENDGNTPMVVLL